jgi:leader peptidase (prepilin peptidase)/N-methyltransferase
MFPLIGLGYFALTTIPLVIFDLRERRLPNKLTVPGLVLTVLSLALTFEWGKFFLALGVSATLFVVGLVMSMRGWIGMGDVKLFASLSLLLAWFDPTLVWQATLWAFGIAGTIVIVGYMAKKITTRSTIALGPYLLVGFWVAISPAAISKLGGAF